MAEKEELNPKIAEIAAALYQHGDGLSAHGISFVTGISYLTVKKYLEILEDKGIVYRIEDIFAKKKRYSGRSPTVRYSLNDAFVASL